MPKINGVINQIKVTGKLNKLFITKEGIEEFKELPYYYRFTVLTKLSASLERISELESSIHINTNANIIVDVISEMLKTTIFEKTKINVAGKILNPIGGYKGFNRQSFNRIEVV